MAQKEGTKEYNTFVKGLITEANPLSFPDNASIDESNFDLFRTGQRVRRSGLDWEGIAPGLVYELPDDNWKWVKQDSLTDSWQTDIVWSPELDIYLSAGSNVVKYSSDGLTWTNATTDLNDTIDGTVHDWGKAAWSPELGLFAVVGSKNDVTAQEDGVDRIVAAWSSDGDNWSGTVIREILHPDDNEVLSDHNRFGDIIWSSRLGLFIAVANQGEDSSDLNESAVLISDDAMSWSIQSTPTGGRWNALTEGPDLVVAVGSNASGPTVMTSPDGSTWTTRTPDIAQSWIDVAYSSSLDTYIAVSSLTSGDHRFMSSSDGINWTGFDPAFAATTPYYSVTWIEELDTFIAIGVHASLNQTYVLYSTENLTWDSADLIDDPSAIDVRFDDIAWSEALGRIVAIGNQSNEIYFAYDDATTSSSTTEQVDTDTETLNTVLWTTDGTDGELTILVVQTGTFLTFFDANAEDIMASPLNSGLSINIGGDPSVPIEAANIFGKLAVVNNQKGFMYLSYDALADDVNAEARIVLVRDIWGVYDSIAVDRRFGRGEITNTREYNLVNQGWAVLETQELPLKLGYMWIAFFHPFYPSNADLVSLTRDLTNNIDPSLLLRSQPGTTPAPKGFFILDAFRRGLSRNLSKKHFFETKTSNFEVDPFSLSKYAKTPAGWREDLAFYDEWSLPRDESEGGFKAVASFAGRVWFSGAAAGVKGGDDNSPNLSSYVFFSQIVYSEDNISKCYQNGDPTSESSPDIVDTDGGAVKIPGMQNVFKMIDTGRSLVVFAENGIWEISGGETNFTATSFEINKVTRTTAISRESIIEVEGAIFFWAEEGIYILQPDQISQHLAAQNITEATIQSFYDDIPAQVKKAARGAFDPVSRKVRWLYSEDSTVAEQGSITLFDSELILDLVLNAFYKYNISSQSEFFLVDYVITNTIVSNSITEVVEDSSGATVEDSNNDDVVITRTLRITGNTGTKFVASDALGHYGIALYKDPLFEDFGVDAPAYLLTGYETLEDTMRDKQAPYITAHFEATENFIDANNKEDESSCLLQTQWDFANDASSEKFGPQQQIYRYPKHFLDAVAAGSTTEYGKLVLSSKTKMRGRGRALSLLFKTEPQKDLRIYGWGVKYTGVTGV